MNLMLDSPGHSATIEIETYAERAFEYLSNPANIGNWALGSWRAEPSGIDGLFVGTSLFDNEPSWLRLDSDARLNLIDYYIGDEEVQLPRVSIRIVPGRDYRGGEGKCLVTITAWRDVTMDYGRWKQLCLCHETEVFLIKSQLERSG